MDDYTVTECDQCGKRKFCLIEKIQSIDIATCRQCYTGLTPDQHQEKVRELVKTMGKVFDDRVPF